MMYGYRKTSRVICFNVTVVLCFLHAQIASQDNTPHNYDLEIGKTWKEVRTKLSNSGYKEDADKLDEDLEYLTLKVSKNIIRELQGASWFSSAPPPKENYTSDEVTLLHNLRALKGALDRNDTGEISSSLQTLQSNAGHYSQDMKAASLQQVRSFFTGTPLLQGVRSGEIISSRQTLRQVPVLPGGLSAQEKVWFFSRYPYWMSIAFFLPLFLTADHRMRQEKSLVSMLKRAILKLRDTVRSSFTSSERKERERGGKKPAKGILKKNVQISFEPTQSVKKKKVHFIYEKDKE